MPIEALTSLRVKMPERDVQIEAGQTIDLPQPFATKLLEKAGGKVKVPDSPILADLMPGARVTWESPLFGKCSGEIALPPENGWLVVRSHSFTGNLAVIRVDWIRTRET